METAVAQPAHLMAPEDAAPVVLRDVEDLHDADLEKVLADRLADGCDASAVAAALARLVALPGPAAMLVHDLGAGAALLATR
jgi:hypothetical protein